MSIWERLSAVTRNLSVGGHISSLLGFGSTSQARKVYSEPDNEVPFTVGVIVLSAKMAKADGTVAADEVKAFKEAFKVSAADMKHVAAIFNSAKRDAANFEACAEQLVTVFKGNHKLLGDVLDGLFQIAKADGEVHRQEEEFLGEVAKRFGLTVGEFNSIKARHMVDAKRNPYDVLGVKPSITDEELDRHYRMLVADDDAEQLIARGVPKEFAIIGIEKRAALSEAYDKIMNDRSKAG
jgi:DnaJ like chaperone protein